MSRPSDEEINKLREENPDLNYRPNIVIDVYKNRRGRWTQIRIWGCNDLGTCRRQEVFVTDIKNMPLENFKLVDFNFNFKIDEEELEEYYNDGVIPTSDNDIDTLVEIVHNSQEAHAEREDDFFISDAFDNKIDKIKRSRKKGFGDYL